jgi:hypothetical protein
LAVLINLIFLFPKRLREYALDNVVEQPTTGKNIPNHRACHALLKGLFETISLLVRVLFHGDSTLYRVASLFALFWNADVRRSVVEQLHILHSSTIVIISDLIHSHLSLYLIISFPQN